MDDVGNGAHPATDWQLERLRRLGLHFSRPVSRDQADWFIHQFAAINRQLACLGRFGLNATGPVGRHEAHRLIGQEIDRRRELPPTPKQEAFLRSRGRSRDGMTRGEAFDLIGQIKSALWGDE